MAIKAFSESTESNKESSDQDEVSGEYATSYEQQVQECEDSLDVTIIKTCMGCSQIFDSEQQLEDHMTNIVPKLNLFCRTCISFFNNTDEHQGCVDKLIAYCFFCKKCLDIDYTIGHICFHLCAKVEDREEIMMKLTKNVRYTYWCEACDKFVPTNLKGDHARQFHGGVKKASSVKTCVSCDMHFSDNNAYNRHKRVDHILYTLCHICGKSVCNWKMRSHIDSHTNNKRYKCTECNKGLHKETLDVRVACYLCNTTFASDLALQNHLENLEAFLKPFCKHCNSFIRFEESTLHQDVTYSCTICKLILSSQNFLEHKCLHKQSSQHLAMTRRQECGICEKLFYSIEDVEAHIHENHSYTFRNVCRCCSITFKSKEAFLKHLDEHPKSILSPIETFSCDFCDVAFKHKKSVLIHQRMVHKIGATKDDKPKKDKKEYKNCGGYI
ncbi:hypothetical protein NQ315_004249 [Exocentrus adspersus]|uniref:C2H2-type domain-containing protein n=1 Tax=Exocentrus adspersus TaxID=1586481 RepID=A0AAV8W6R8_9CUCU|nr:hypothetical protein NQ315_004249 [Exocentrus adspersus]